MALFLRDDDVQQSVSMSEMLEAIENMQNKYGRGEAYNLARRKIIAPGGLLSVMGGGLYYDNILGVKTYTVVKGKYSFQVSLYNAETGELLCYTQANRLGQLRTGATTGIAVKYLSNPNSATLGIIGTGYQAPTQLEAISKVRNIQSVKAFSPTAEHRESFAANMTNRFNIPVVSVDSAKEVVEESDIVITLPPKLLTFSVAYCATFPDPEIDTILFFIEFSKFIIFNNKMFFFTNIFFICIIYTFILELLMI